jgi:hypothetical protein
MDDELERMWNEVVELCFKDLFQHLPRGTEKKLENLWTKYEVQIITQHLMEDL